MGVLHALTSDAVPFRWDFTHQRAFEEIKESANKCRNHHRKPLDHTNGAPPINVVTDGCITGIAGFVSQGEDWKNAPVAAFYSAKLSPAQQNYPVHEIEMLAGLETMMRYRDLLLGTHFRWYTDHKGLVTLLTHKDVSGRRARWLENLAMFDFKVIYVPGEENILSDALSRIYSNKGPGTVRAESEYTEHDGTAATMEAACKVMAAPVLVGLEACAISKLNYVSRRNTKAAREAAEAESRRPETAEEYAARMKGKLTLKGPRKLVRKAKKHTPVKVDDSASDSDVEAPHLPPLDLTSKELDNIDILAHIRLHYNDDPFFKNIIIGIAEHKNFVYTDGLLCLLQNDIALLCVPGIKIGDRSVREVIIAEAHTLLQ